MNREISFCHKLGLFQCKDKFMNEIYFSTNEMYFSTIRGENFGEYLGDEASAFGQYQKDNFNKFFINHLGYNS